VSIFVAGALFAFYQGFTTVLGEPEEQESALLAYGVLALAFAIESVSWVRALRQVREEARAVGRSMSGYLRWIDDPTTKTVLFEDSAALTGICSLSPGSACTISPDRLSGTVSPRSPSACCSPSSPTCWAGPTRDC
jgi:hypothetical protein